jgi:hypothetical protein
MRQNVIMKTPQIALVFLTQTVGVVFFLIFLAAFYVPMPSNETLIGDPSYRNPLSIFGAIFLALTVIVVVVAYVGKRKAP